VKLRKKPKGWRSENTKERGKKKTCSKRMRGGNHRTRQEKLAGERWYLNIGDRGSPCVGESNKHSMIGPTRFREPPEKLSPAKLRRGQPE